jgi:hypothetical protein
MLHYSGYGSGGHMRNNIVGWERLIILKIHNRPRGGRALEVIRGWGVEIRDDNLVVARFRVAEVVTQEFCSHKMTPRSKVKERET